MNIKRILIVGLLSFGVIPTFSKENAEFKYNITEAEKESMLNEADDYIDDMPEGKQDREADAIYHAMRGMSAELDQLRSKWNTPVFKNNDNISSRSVNQISNGRNIMFELYFDKEQEQTPSPLLLFIHGGGWIKGGFENTKEYCNLIASKGIKVADIDYSLSPEKPFPEGLKDCIETIKYILDNITEWNVNNEIYLSGEDAGANLALASMFYLISNNEDISKIKGLVIYDPILSTESERSEAWKKYGRGYGLDSRLVEAYFYGYLQEDSNKEDSEYKNEYLKSPLDTDDMIIKKLPAVLMIGAGRDIFLNQEELLINKLNDNDIEVTFIVLDGAIHGFISDGNQKTAMKKAVELTAGFIKINDD